MDRARQLAGQVHLHPCVEAVFHPQHGCMLTWLDPEPRRSSLLGRIFQTGRRRHQLTLDELGRQTIELIDGQRSVEAIARKLASANSGDLDTMRDAVLVFLSALMRRNIVLVTDPSLV